MAQTRSRNRQAELFPRAKRAVPIAIDENHRFVHVTEEIDWTEIEGVVQSVRMSKVKNGAGRPPQLRALTGAVVFRAVRRMSYRETEDQIRYYLPARYLCGLTETEWTPDANTIQDFEQLLGEEGMKQINEYVVKWAVEEKLADPRVLTADTTAQEARIPYPNEMGLMAAFMTAVVAASRSVGGKLKGFMQKSGDWLQQVKRKVRQYRLFAKDKTKAIKNRMVAEVADLVDRVQQELGEALVAGSAHKERLRKYGKVAWAKVTKLHGTMGKLLPQIRHWLKTGHVAPSKIINLRIPELYAIVRGKVGKPVEFGLTWGIGRLGGGFLLGTRTQDKRELVDSKFAIRAVRDHITMFGKAPRGYGYDRGGWSRGNVKELKRLGVQQVGVAPRGRAQWLVDGKVKERLVSERAQVEGGIGNIKCDKYGFNRPAAQSAAMMGMCGQRSLVGFNLTKLIRGLAQRKEVVLVG